MIVQLQWAASADTTVKWYNVYRGMTTGGPYIQIARHITALNFTDQPDFGDWFYVISAENCCSEGLYSAEVSVTATASPTVPTSVSASIGNCGSTSPITPGGGSGFGEGGFGEGPFPP